MVLILQLSKYNIIVNSPRVSSFWVCLTFILAITLDWSLLLINTHVFQNTGCNYCDCTIRNTGSIRSFSQIWWLKSHLSSRFPVNNLTRNGWVTFAHLSLVLCFFYRFGAAPGRSHINNDLDGDGSSCVFKDCSNFARFLAAFSVWNKEKASFVNYSEKNRKEKTVLSN